MRAAAAAGVLQNVTCQSAGLTGVMELQPGLVDSAVALLAAAAAQLAAAAAAGSMFAGDSSARKQQQQQQHCQSTATSLAGALANICSSPTGAAHVAAALSKEQLHALVAVMLEQPPANGANGLANGQSEDVKQQAQQLQQLQKHLLGLLYNLIGSHQQKDKKAGVVAALQQEQQQKQAEAAAQSQPQGQSPQQQQAQQFLQQQAGQPMVSPRDKPSKSLLSIFSKGAGSPARGLAGGADAQEAPKPATAAAAAAAATDPIGEVTSALRAISGQQPALLVRLQQLAGLGQAAAGKAGGGQGNGKEAKGSASSDEQARVQILLRVLRA